MTKSIKSSFQIYENLYHQAKFDEAFILSVMNLKEIESLKDSSRKYLFLAQIAGNFVDLGHVSHNSKASNIGINLFESYVNEFLKVISEDSYYYCLANAKRNLIQHQSNNSFETGINEMELLVEVSNLLWKAIKSAKAQDKIIPPEFLVNIANVHKQQNRVCEALKFYDEVCKRNLDIPQAWINRSECLILLNNIDSNFSVKTLSEIIKGYQIASKSRNIPVDFSIYYEGLADYYQNQLQSICNEEDMSIDNSEDEILNEEEFLHMSKYRQWTVANHLSLSEHALYCFCIETERDNLTIPDNSGKVIGGNEIFVMEMILNRIKSEFGFSRRLYYEYLLEGFDKDIEHELCFSELYDGELLGYRIEKLKNSFKICFAILDKIANAIAKFFDFQPKKRNIYFQSFWNLEDPDRLNKFKSIHNHGLLALYSIACDLNSSKSGELSFYKKWRNTLEHNFLVVYKQLKPDEELDTNDLSKKVIYVEESDFRDSLEQVLQLTRSAIFSFVYAIREKAKNDNIPVELTGKLTLQRKDYKI